MIVYTKYNPARKEDYQLATTITNEDDRLHVFKNAYKKKAKGFLDSLFDKYDYLNATDFPFNVLKPEKSGNAVKYDYLPYKSMDTLLFDAIQKRDKVEILTVFKSYADLLDKIPIVKRPLSNNFFKIFGGEKSTKKVECIKFGCLDLILENIFVSSETKFLLDYEWTFFFPIPKKYLLHRVIINSYYKYISYDLNQILPIKETFEYFDITVKEEDTFWGYELNFQDYITGGKLDLTEYKKDYYERILKGDPQLSLLKKEEYLRKQSEEQEKLIIEKEAQILVLKNQISECEQKIRNMEFSKFWKLRSYFLKVKKIPEVYRIAIYKGVTSFKRGGPLGLIRGALRHVVQSKGRVWKFPPERGNYHDWIEKNESWSIEQLSYEMKAFKILPKISVIVPVYNVLPKWLDLCIQSVVSQFYQNWELCFYDDASTNKETKECLKTWEKLGDSRIKVKFGPKNLHISGSSNEALKMATGEFIALLDNDDELMPNALFEVAKLLNVHPEADMIYSDEDKMDEEGKRSGPFFKPDWSPDLFFSCMYTCHLGVYRKTIIDQIGGFRNGYEGAQDYDLVLRFIEKTKPERIFHIRKILYHWKMIETSTAFSANAKNYAYEAAVKALQNYLDRNKIDAKAIHATSRGFYRIVREIKGNPLVSIIIPFRDKPEVLKRCLNSILTKTDYQNYEILLLDNGSKEEKTIRYLETLMLKEKIRVLKYNKPFNYSRINNFGVKKASGDYALFLNNDTEVINSDWLGNMLGDAQRQEVGAVGAELLYPNKTIQHAGVVILSNVTPIHAYNGTPINSPEYNDLIKVSRNYSAVTAACLLMRKELFEKVGGFDDDGLAVAYNDVDLCLKLRKLGYLIVYNPFAKLYHYEGLSRGKDSAVESQNDDNLKRFLHEQKALQEKWQGFIPIDPYY